MLEDIHLKNVPFTATSRLKYLDYSAEFTEACNAIKKHIVKILAISRHNSSVFIKS